MNIMNPKEVAQMTRSLANDGVLADGGLNIIGRHIYSHYEELSSLSSDGEEKLENLKTELNEILRSSSQQLMKFGTATMGARNIGSALATKLEDFVEEKNAVFSAAPSISI